MPVTPFLEREQWRTEKQKYCIPDNVLKGGKFGEQMQKLVDKYVKEGLDRMTKAKVPVAKELLSTAKKLYAGWLEGAKSMKDEMFNNKEKKEGAKNKQGAIKRVEYYQSLLQDLENKIAQAVDYFVTVRAQGRNKTAERFKAALQQPTDPNLLHQLYSQGIRNELGVYFHKALEAKNQFPSEVVTLLNQYENLAAKWNDLQKGVTPEFMKDTEKVKVFFTDMKQLMDIGDKILDKTK